MDITFIVLNSFVNDIRVQKEAASLASAGYDVTVIALWKQGLAKSEQCAGYRVIRIPLFTQKLKDRLFSPPLKYLEFAWKAWRYAGLKPSQVYQANDANTLPAAWIAAKRNQAKLIYDARELETGRNFRAGYISRIYQRIWALPERLFIRKAQSVITVSPMIADMLSRLYQIPKPVVIYNCPLKTTVQKSNKIREDLNISEDKSIVLYHGLVAKGRGIETFLDAVQLVENIVGVVLGDGPLLIELRKKAVSGEWQRVYLPGRFSISDISEYTSSSDLGVVLTQDTCINHRVTLPNKLFDYIHAGLPVICSNLPALEQILREYQIGVLVDPDDPVSIAQGIKSILGDAERYKKLKANTSAAADDFNWQNEQNKLIKIYEKVKSD